MTRSCLYAGTVMHRRLRPFRHQFRYGVYSLFVDLDELPELAGRTRLLAIDRPGLLSFQQRDHGAGDVGGLRAWAEALLRQNGVDIAGGSVRLLYFQRVLGYVFNPLSVFFCEDAGGRLAALIYQVNNTFGDRHFYLYPVPTDAPSAGPMRHACEKAFYVSPFIGMRSTYHFHTRLPDDRLALAIRQTVPEGGQLVATLSGRRRELRDGVLARLALSVPVAGIQVLAAIHWQALKLWLKGARYHPRPSAGGAAAPRVSH